MISLQNGMPRQFLSVYDAYDFLLHEWALPLGKLYNDAVLRCREVLHDNGCHEAARDAFVAVSRLQNCLIDTSPSAAKL